MTSNSVQSTKVFFDIVTSKSKELNPFINALKQHLAVLNLKACIIVKVVDTKNSWIH